MKYFIGLIFMAFITSSCKKMAAPLPSTSLNVINASAGLDNAKVSTAYTGYYSEIAGVYYYSNFVYTIPVSSAFSVSSSVDSTKILYNATVGNTSGAMYSLYLAGNGGNDVVFLQDQIPNHPDSSFSVRFINLSSNSGNVNVTLAASPTIKEFSGVAYKSIADFKSYNAKSADVKTYVFQVRNYKDSLLATSSNVLASTVRFRCITLALIGTLGGTGTSTPGVMVINNY